MGGRATKRASVEEFLGLIQQLQTVDPEEAREILVRIYKAARAVKSDFTER